MRRQLQYQAIVGSLVVFANPVVTVNYVHQPFSEPIFKRSYPAHLAQATAFVPQPSTAPQGWMGAFSEPSRKRAPVADGYTRAPTQSQQSFAAAFAQSFSEPIFSRKFQAYEQPFVGLVEVIPTFSFGWYAQFSEPLRAKVTINVAPWNPVIPQIVVQDTHDGVYVKKKTDNKKRDQLFDQELEDKAKRRQAIVDAIHPPEPEIVRPEPVFAPQFVPPPIPPQFQLAGLIAQSQADRQAALKLQEQHNEEEALAMLLRDT